MDTVVVIGTNIRGYIGEVRGAVPAVLQLSLELDSLSLQVGGGYVVSSVVSKQGAAAIS